MGEPAVDSFMDAVAGAATAKKPAKTKKEMPSITLTDDLRKMVDEHQAFKKAEKQAKAAKDSVATEIIKAVREIQDEHGFEGKFRHAYLCPGFESEVKYVSSNRFSISYEDKPEINELLGDDMPRLIEELFDVKLKDVVKENPVMRQELMDMLGERLTDFFDVSGSLAVRESFDSRVYEVVSKGDLLTLRTFVRPYKPSLR